MQVDLADSRREEVLVASRPASARGPESIPAGETPDIGETFKYAVEGALRGMFDLDAFLDMALILARLDVDPRAVPEPDPSGAIRFPLRGTPEGIQAEFWVRKTSNSDLGRDVFSLYVTTTSEKEPPFIEGAARQPPGTEITVWTDHNGRLRNFVVLATMNPDGRATKRLGIPLSEGEIPMSLFYSYDVDDPSQCVLRMSGLVDGRLANLTRPIVTSGDPQRRMTDVVQLGKSVLDLHGKLKQ
ncbi:MAG: hypothetical protein L0323_23785 [Planctomycetes bacterium]|nr:hypothetical protein [Planctomycetota bacterium]